MIMKNILLHILLGAILLLNLVACEEVITLDLDVAEPKLVIEAIINGTKNYCSVNLSLSQRFYDDNEFEMVDGATVQLTNEAGESLIIPRISIGKFKLENILINEKSSYSITITTPDGKEYSASTISTVPVILQHLTASEKNRAIRGNTLDEGTYQIAGIFTDPINIENYYRFKITVNGEYDPYSYVLIDDDSRDGHSIAMIVARKLFDLGDSISVELLSIDKKSYDYFIQVAEQSGEGFNSTTPYTPSGNFDNGALGYFGIWYSDKKIIVTK